MSDSPIPSARVNYLPLPSFIKLNNACIPLSEAFGGAHPYLVGSSNTRPDWRDVDVRLIMLDEDYDALFGGQLPHFWSFFCLAVSDYLSRASDLPVDFQVQRDTEANAANPTGMRNPLGMRARLYAGGPEAAIGTPNTSKI